MNFIKRNTLRGLLPAFKCTEEMRKEVKEIAKNEGVSIGEVQRTAMDIFLSEYAKNRSNNRAEISGDVQCSN